MKERSKPERKFPDFNPAKDRIILNMTRDQFLLKKPEAETGQATVGGILHMVTWSEDGNTTFLTPMQQTGKIKNLNKNTSQK